MTEGKKWEEELRPKLSHNKGEKGGGGKRDHGQNKAAKKNRLRGKISRAHKKGDGHQTHLSRERTSPEWGGGKSPHRWGDAFVLGRHTALPDGEKGRTKLQKEDRKKR